MILRSVLALVSSFPRLLGSELNSDKARALMTNAIFYFMPFKSSYHYASESHGAKKDAYNIRCVVNNLDFIPIPVWLPVSHKDTAPYLQSSSVIWHDTDTSWRDAASITQCCSTWFSAMVILEQAARAAGDDFHLSHRYVGLLQPPTACSRTNSQHKQWAKHMPLGHVSFFIKSTTFLYTFWQLYVITL